MRVQMIGTACYVDDFDGNKLVDPIPDSSWDRLVVAESSLYSFSSDVPAWRVWLTNVVASPATWLAFLIGVLVVPVIWVLRRDSLGRNRGRSEDRQEQSEEAVL